MSCCVESRRKIHFKNPNKEGFSWKKKHATCSCLPTPKKFQRDYSPFCRHSLTAIEQENWDFHAPGLNSFFNWNNLRFTRINLGLGILVHLYPSQNIMYSIWHSNQSVLFAFATVSQLGKGPNPKSGCLMNPKKPQASRSFRICRTFRNNLFRCHRCWHLSTQWLTRLTGLHDICSGRHIHPDTDCCAF